MFSSRVPMYIVQGKDGTPGSRGDKGSAGLEGKKGEAGERGKRGKKGDKGPTGAPGLDAPCPTGTAKMPKSKDDINHTIVCCAVVANTKVQGSSLGGGKQSSLASLFLQ